MKAHTLSRISSYLFNTPIFADFGVEFLQVGGCHWEGMLDGDAAQIEENIGQLVTFGCLQDSQLIVRLTCWEGTKKKERLFIICKE